MPQRPASAQMRFDTLAEIQALGTSVRDGQKAYARDTAREYRYTTAGGWEVIPIKSEVDAKANTSHTHVISDTSGLQAFLDNLYARDDYQFYSRGPRVKPVIELEATAVSSGGNFIFNLTSDGTASGAAKLANSVILGTANLVILDPNGGNYKEGSYTLSANKKQLTVSVKKQSYPLASVLGINVAVAPLWEAIPNGVTGYVSVKGT